MLPALLKAELILGEQGRAIARRATRVPADAIVALGAALAPVRAARRINASSQSAQAAVANDNDGPTNSRTRTIMREIAFLIVFGATLAGTYYIGRMHAFQNVIVVPDRATEPNKLV